MVREAPKDIPKNGKKYHIHTFGCQVRLVGAWSHHYTADRGSVRCMQGVAWRHAYCTLGCTCFAVSGSNA